MTTSRTVQPIADELELKAVVPDPAALIARLRAVAGPPDFAGLMEDRRFDRDGELSARDEVLRVRTYRHADGSTTAQLAWKGPTRQSPDGYKARRELECKIAPASAPPGALLKALGYGVVYALDRYVEVFTVAGATVRVEWYPRMDVLVEVEGTPEAIEAAVRATELERASFTAESLPAFVARYASSSGRAPALTVAALEGEPPGWETR